MRNGIVDIEMVHHRICILNETKQGRERHQLNFRTRPPVMNARNPDLRCTLLLRTAHPSVEETRLLLVASVHTCCAIDAQFGQERQSLDLVWADSEVRQKQV